MDLFEKIINKEIKSNIIYEDEKVIAFMDINPKSPGHFLVVPKIHSTNLIDIDDKDLEYLMVKSKELANIQIDKMNVSGYNIIINNGKEAGQEIFHTHVHVIPSKK